jgi:hypothetical protein
MSLSTSTYPTWKQKKAIETACRTPFNVEILSNVRRRCSNENKQFIWGFVAIRHAEVSYMILGRLVPVAERSKSRVVLRLGFEFRSRQECVSRVFLLPFRSRNYKKLITSKDSYWIYETQASTPLYRNTNRLYCGPVKFSNAERRNYIRRL